MITSKPIPVGQFSDHTHQSFEKCERVGLGLMQERALIGRRFRNDTERLEKLFELYTKMTGAKAAGGEAA